MNEEARRKFVEEALKEGLRKALSLLALGTPPNLWGQQLKALLASIQAHLDKLSPFLTLPPQFQGVLTIDDVILAEAIIEAHKTPPSPAPPPPCGRMTRKPRSSRRQPPPLPRTWPKPEKEERPPTIEAYTASIRRKLLGVGRRFFEENIFNIIPNGKIEDYAKYTFINPLPESISSKGEIVEIPTQKTTAIATPQEAFQIIARLIAKAISALGQNLRVTFISTAFKEGIQSALKNLTPKNIEAVGSINLALSILDILEKTKTVPLPENGSLNLQDIVLFYSLLILNKK